MGFKQGRSIAAWAVAAALGCCLAAQPRAMQTSAEAAILIEASGGRVLYEQNADRELLIASTTKIMTAVVALENSSADDVVSVTQAHMAEGSSMYLKPGEQVSMETLLYGLLLCSGNDAALAIADHCGPGVAAFVEKMNEKARQIGMEHTSFANPNGLDQEGHYSTARDMARLAAYAMQQEDFARIAATKSITIDGRTLVNHNKLLSRYDGCIGVKTGYTKAAGRTLVSCAERGGMRLIAVTLHDGNDWADHAALYDAGFAQYHMECAAECGETAAVLPVLNGTQRAVDVVYGEEFSYPIRSDETISCRMEMADCAFAPIAARQQVGECIFLLNGQEIGRVPLLYAAGAEALPVRTGSALMQKLYHLFIS